jgi:hypothetical protein
MARSNRFEVVARLLLNPLLLLSGAAMIMLPGALRLGKTRPTAQDGVVTIDDAIAACKDSGLSGWALVTFAQNLVRRKFTIYTTRNLWDSPARAFERGLGYCTQYNLALKEILDGLGFETRVVFCLKVRNLADDRWAMGHTWLKVTTDGQERDVCAGRLQNRPGRNQFMPLLPVLPAPGPVPLLTHLGVILLSGFVEWKATLTGRPAPYWTYIEGPIGQPVS